MKSTLVHVDCQFSPGMFDTEYAILLSTTAGNVSLFADKDLVVVNGSKDHGYLKATALTEIAAPVVDVLLPNETELGTRVVGVPRERVKIAA